MLRLTGDDEGFDNTAYFAASELERVTIAYFGSESANDPENCVTICSARFRRQPAGRSKWFRLSRTRYLPSKR